MPNTVRLHRVLATKPDKVYRAFHRARRDRQVAPAEWLHFDRPKVPAVGAADGFARTLRLGRPCSRSQRAAVE
jgi:hypothetical protein